MRATWLLGLLAPTLAVASPTLSYQGRLLDDLGTPLEGQHAVGVELFDVPADGEAVHSETFTEVLSQGYFSVVLGAGSTPLDLADLAGDLWVEVTADPPGVALTRQRLAEVPRAVTARTLGPVDTVTGTTALTVDDTTVLADASGGSFTVTLPSAVGLAGKVFTVTRVDDTLSTSPGVNTVVTLATTASEQFLGGANTTTTGLFYEGESITVQSTGSGWAWLSGGPVRTFSFYLPFAGGCPSPSIEVHNAVASCVNNSTGQLTTTLRSGYCADAPKCTATARQSFAISPGNSIITVAGFFTSSTSGTWHQAYTAIGGGDTQPYGGVHGAAMCTCLR